MLAGAYGGWIRPVSARPTAEVCLSEYKYDDYTSPKLLDIVRIPLLKADPRHHQIENHVIDAARWVKQGELSWDALEPLRDQPISLWINGGHTSAGLNDCISHAEATTVHDSLLLIKPGNFAVEVGRNHWTGRKSYRGKFEYNGTHHNLSVTDPIVRDAFAGEDEGDYPLNDSYLCVSLTEPYEHDDRCHKLIAAVISKGPLRT